MLMKNPPHSLAITIVHAVKSSLNRNRFWVPRRKIVDDYDFMT